SHRHAVEPAAAARLYRAGARQHSHPGHPAGAFSSPEEGLTFHIRERATNGELLGLIVHDTRNKELTSRTWPSTASSSSTRRPIISS
ncbi:MAG: hypothetical protein WDN31_21930, partial [Hyphomicrobium sp.]